MKSPGFPVLAATLVVSCSLLSHAEASSDLPATSSAPMLRALDVHTDRVIEAGVQASPSFRRLVDRVMSGPVVVYVKAVNLPLHLDGQLKFMAASEGFRYVVIELRLDLTVKRRIAILGHELQHAVEIAERPGIIDRCTLAREFRTFGIERKNFAMTETAYETEAAIAVQREIWRELTARTNETR